MGTFFIGLLIFLGIVRFPRFTIACILFSYGWVFLGAIALFVSIFGKD